MKRTSPPEVSPPSQEEGRSLFRSPPGWGLALTVRQNAEQLFKDEINTLRQKWMRSQARKSTAESIHKDKKDGTESPMSSSELIENVLIEPDHLFVVVRRLPYQVKFSARKEDERGEQEGHEVRVGGAVDKAQDVEEELVFTEDDSKTARPLINGRSGRWKVVTSTFHLDYIQVFKSQLTDKCKVVLVGDPGVELSHLTADPEEEELLRDRLVAFLATLNTVPVWLSSTAKKERYSEDLLYPLFHYRTPPIGTGFSYLDWPGYSELNRSFAKCLSTICGEKDWFIVMNFHLMLLPKMLRDIPKCTSSIIFFYLPSVFPSSEMYRILPDRQDLLTGLLHASIIGFHSDLFRSHFMTAATRVLGVESTAHTIEPCMESGGFSTRISVIPMGVSVQPWIELTQKLDLDELKHRFKGKQVILGVDSLDWSKGIPQKLTAFRKFLTDYPSYSDGVVFIQLCFVGKGATADAGHSSTYKLSSVDRKEILAQAFQVSGHINSAFGTVDHLPVHFLVGSFSVRELAPVYSIAHIGVMTGLRESMSTSMYHYILCQAKTNKGVAIVSEFTASSQMLSGAALQVNPWDINNFAEAIKDALCMPEEERRARHDLAYSIVTKADSKAWARGIINEIRDVALEETEERLDVPPPLDIVEAAKQLSSASHLFVVCGMRETLLKSPDLILGEDLSEPQYNLKDYDNDPHPSILDQPRTANLTVNHAAPEVVVTPSCMGTSQSEITHSPMPVSPAPISMLVPQGTVGVRDLSSMPNVTVMIASSSSTSVLQGVLKNAPDIWGFAENGHYVSMPGSTDFVPFPSQEEIEHGEEEELRRSLNQVGDLVDYFAKRTPGSFKRKTETSVAWHYGSADSRFARQQAKDLLFHLYAGPLLNKRNLELCAGKASVEVRSSKVTKSMAIEWAIRKICDESNLAPQDMGVLVIGNFLPRDEDLYPLAVRLCKGGNGRKSRPSLNNGQLASPLSRTGTFSDDQDEEARSRCVCCTVGVRFSKAQYRLESKSQISGLFVKLAHELSLKEKGVTNRQMSPIFSGNDSLSIPRDPARNIPAVDIALAMTVPGAPYYNYLPATAGSTRFSQTSSTRPRRLARRLTNERGLPSPSSIQSDLHRSGGRRVGNRIPPLFAGFCGSDWEDEMDNDDSDMDVLGASMALNVPNAIPFTHARIANWLDGSGMSGGQTAPHLNAAPASEAEGHNVWGDLGRAVDNNNASAFLTPDSTLPPSRKTSNDKNDS